MSKPLTKTEQECLKILLEHKRQHTLAMAERLVDQDIPGLAEYVEASVIACCAAMAVRRQPLVRLLDSGQYELTQLGQLVAEGVWG